MATEKLIAYGALQTALTAADDARLDALSGAATATVAASGATDAAILATSAAGITPVADLASIPATPGLYRTLDTGYVYERPAGGAAPQRREALEAAPKTEVLTVRNALGNLTLTELSARPISAGPQLADGSRWVGQATGTPDGGTVVPATGGGYWHREYSGQAAAEWYPTLSAILPAAATPGPPRVTQVSEDHVLTAPLDLGGYFNIEGTYGTDWFQIETDRGGGMSSAGAQSTLLLVSGQDLDTAQGFFQKIGAGQIRRMKFASDYQRAQRAIHVTAGGGPLGPLILEDNVFKGFPTAAIDVTMPGGVYPPNAHPEIRGQPITTSVYNLGVRRSTFNGNGVGRSLRATGANAIGGLEFMDNTLGGGASVQIGTQALYGYGRFNNNLAQGCLNAFDIGCGLANVELTGNYFEANTGYLARVAATNPHSSVRIHSNYNKDDGGLMVLGNLRANVDQSRMDIQAAGVHFTALECRALYPDVSVVAFNTFAPHMARLYRGTPAAPRGGAVAGYAITGSAARLTPYGELQASDALADNYAALSFALNAGDTLVVNTYVQNTTDTERMLSADLFSGDVSAYLFGSGGLTYVTLAPGEGRFLSFAFAVPAAYASALFRVKCAQAGVFWTRPYAYATPGGAPLSLMRAN